MSRYRLISNYRIAELLTVVGLVCFLTILAFKESRGYLRNSFAGNFIMEIQNAKTNAAIKNAFTGLQSSDETKVIHTQTKDEYSSFEYLHVNNKGKITLSTSDKNSDFWSSPHMRDDFAERVMFMYIHQTGTPAYGFSLLSCEPNTDNQISEKSSNESVQLDRSHYRLYCH